MPAFAVPADPKISPRTVGGPAMQAPTSKRRGFRKNISLFCNSIVGGENCSPAKALCCRKALRVEQSPTPTMNRDRMLMCGKVTHKNLIDGSPYSEKRKLKIFHFPY